MDYKAIHELIDIMNKSDLYSLEIENSEIKIKMKKGPDVIQNVSETESITTTDAVKNEFKGIDASKLKEDISEKEDNEDIKEEEPIDEANIYYVKSPMVGTFYVSAGPDKDAFVSKGTSVKKGDVLCIIEAMKLMNEIECEYDGTVEEILTENGDMAEYGQVLMKIKKA